MVINNTGENKKKKLMVILGVMSALILNTAVSADTKATQKQLNLPNLPAKSTGNYLLNYDSVTEVFFWASTLYLIGETGPQGGIVVHTSDDGSHGLEAAPEDQSIATWGCNGRTEISGADGTAFGTGQQNTSDILAGCFDAGIAAEVATNYVWPNGQADGFLPSKDELNLMWKNLADSDGDGVNT